MVKRLIDTTAREVAGYGSHELVAAIRGSEGRVLAAEMIAPAMATVFDVSNPELAAGMGARDAAAAGLFYGSRAADLAALGRSLGPRDVAANQHLAFADPGATTSPSGFDFVTFDQPERW